MAGFWRPPPGGARGQMPPPLPPPRYATGCIIHHVDRQCTTSFTENSLQVRLACILKRSYEQYRYIIEVLRETLESTILQPVELSHTAHFSTYWTFYYSSTAKAITQEITSSALQTAITCYVCYTWNVCITFIFIGKSTQPV